MFCRKALPVQCMWLPRGFVCACPLPYPGCVSTPCPALSLRVEREEAAVRREEVQHELEKTISQLSDARGALLDGAVGAPVVRTLHSSSVPPALYPQLCTPLCLPAPTLGSPACPSYAHAAAVGRGVGPDSLAILGRAWPVLNPDFARGSGDQAPRSSSGKFRPALPWVRCVCCRWAVVGAATVDGAARARRGAPAVARG
jgi:hypothetical protein